MVLFAGSGLLLGRRRVQIAERQGGRDKVLEHLGSAHTNADLKALLEAARRRIHPGQDELDLSEGSVPAGQSVITGKSSGCCGTCATG